MTSMVAHVGYRRGRERNWPRRIIDHYELAHHAHVLMLEDVAVKDEVADFA